MTWLWLLIPAVLVGVIVGFYLGIRYTAKNLLPLLMSRLTTGELRDLAKQAAQLRAPGDIE